MDQNIINSFNLTLDESVRKYGKIPYTPSGVFYHYTSKTGLEGILRSGGLRATFRGNMNDNEEFSYAKNIIYEYLEKIENNQDLPNVKISIAKYTQLNLYRLLIPKKDDINCYCACLTTESDSRNQWDNYADNGKGYVIGFNLYRIAKNQVQNLKIKRPFIYFLPVIYDENEQFILVKTLVEAGISDLNRFIDRISSKQSDLTALRDRITSEIITQLFIFCNFMKNPVNSGENELRLMMDLNDGTMNVREIEHFIRDEESIPFILFDFRDPTTNVIPIKEIKIGPKAEYSEEKAFMEGLLRELGYENSNVDYPSISISKFTVP